MRRLTCLVYLLGGFHLQVTGQTCSCEETGGCNFTKTCLPGDNCTKRNVVLGKAATMSSVFNRTTLNETSGPACLAVNGNTGTVFRPINRYPDSPNCVHTADGDKTPFWEVDLGQAFSIVGITVYARDIYTSRMTHANLSVDNFTHFVFSQNNISVRTEIPFWPPVKGRRVRLAQHRVVPGDPYPFVNMCEMQVWTCPGGSYGFSCALVCGICSKDTLCDPRDGRCPSGCADGYQGQKCDQACVDGYFGPDCGKRCVACKNNSSCETVTGYCPAGCESGWQGPRCDQACLDGFFGQNCYRKCGYCQYNYPCDAVTGNCPSDCDSGWQGLRCNKTCAPGSYGRNCALHCGQCINGVPCNHVDGMCMSIDCVSGCHGDFSRRAHTNGPLAGLIASAIAGSFVIFAIVMVVIQLFLEQSTGLQKMAREPKHLRKAQAGPHLL